MITALQHEQLFQIDLLLRRGFFDQIPATDAALLYQTIDAQPETLHAACRYCHRAITCWSRGCWRHQDDRSLHCTDSTRQAAPEALAA